MDQEFALTSRGDDNDHILSRFEGLRYSLWTKVRNLGNNMGGGFDRFPHFKGGVGCLDF